jgi:cation:H+ antiporter
MGYVLTAVSLILTGTNGKKHKLSKKTGLSVGLQVLKIIAGSWILIMSSNLLVKETILLAEKFGISTFVISLLGISVGTNLPEISLGIRSLLDGKKDVAFGNYLGSALFNILILSVLGLVSQNNEINISGNFVTIALVTVTGLIAFYFFATSKREISRKEGIYLLLLYVAFLLTELLYQTPA